MVRTGTGNALWRLAAFGLLVGQSAASMPALRGNRGLREAVAEVATAEVAGLVAVAAMVMCLLALAFVLAFWNRPIISLSDPGPGLTPVLVLVAIINTSVVLASIADGALGGTGDRVSQDDEAAAVCTISQWLFFVALPALMALVTAKAALAVHSGTRRRASVLLAPTLAAAALSSGLLATEELPAVTAGTCASVDILGAPHLVAIAALTCVLAVASGVASAYAARSRGFRGEFVAMLLASLLGAGLAALRLAAASVPNVDVAIAALCAGLAIALAGILVLRKWRWLGMTVEDVRLDHLAPREARAAASKAQIDETIISLGWVPADGGKTTAREVDEKYGWAAAPSQRGLTPKGDNGRMRFDFGELKEVPLSPAGKDAQGSRQPAQPVRRLSVEETDKVIAIQRTFRGARTRSRMIALPRRFCSSTATRAEHNAATTLQAAHRGHRCRSDSALKQHKSARVIQAAYRGSRTRHKLFARFFGNVEAAGLVREDDASMASGDGSVFRVDSVASAPSSPTRRTSSRFVKKIRLQAFSSMPQALSRTLRGRRRPHEDSDHETSPQPSPEPATAERQGDLAVL